MLRAVIGVGSNLGDSIATMQRALDALSRAPGASVIRVSRAYTTTPVGQLDQPDFVNAAALVAWESTPHALLDTLLSIEVSLGRVRDRDARYGPRTIDLDVLYIDGVALNDARLTVPHPRLLERAFALIPLLEVLPDAAVLARHATGLVLPTGSRSTRS